MESIFVSVVSYRDIYLQQTIRSLLDNVSAKYRIVVGILDQNIESSLIESDNDNVEIRYMFIPHQYALGCGWARFMNISQYQNEDYYFSIDSHMLFDKNWDDILIEQYKECGVNTVMTMMPYVCHADENNIMKCEMFHTNLSHKTKFFIMDKTHTACAHAVFETAKTQETQYIFGGSTIGSRSWVKDVVCNYYMSQYWMAGEEMTLTMESFFKGYKIYAGERPVTAHLFYSTKKVWSYDNTEKQYSKSVLRGVVAWKNYLASKTEEELKAFHEYSGVDFINMKIDDWAGYVEWPFLNKPDDLKYPLDLKKQLEYESTLI